VRYYFGGRARLSTVIKHQTHSLGPDLRIVLARHNTQPSKEGGAQGEFNWSSQHLELEVSDGQAYGVDDDGDGAAGDAIAGAAADSPRCGAFVLGQNR
jgi:hypothetical protein